MTTPLDDMLDTDAPYMLTESEVEELNEICEGLERLSQLATLEECALLIKPHSVPSIARIIRAGIEVLSNES